MDEPPKIPSENILLAPIILGLPEHQALNAADIAFWDNAEELEDEGAMPRIIVLYVFMQLLVRPGEREE